MEQRKCRVCEEIKDIVDFAIIKKGVRGYKCKVCHLEYRHKLHPPKPKVVIPVGFKNCSHCKQLLPFAAFHEQRKQLDKNDRDRYYYICKECLRIKRVNSPHYVHPTKICSICGVDKPVSEFNKNYNGYMDRCKLCEKDYRDKNSDRIKLTKLKNKKAKTEKQREYNRRWKSENKEKVATQTRNRYARVNNMEGTHSYLDIEELYLEQLGRCPYCKEYLHGTGYHVDHMIPVARTELSPTNYPSNLQLLCCTCNLIKNDKTPEEFVDYIKIAHPERYQKYIQIYG